jgi:hypothetical protein
MLFCEALADTAAETLHIQELSIESHVNWLINFNFSCVRFFHPNPQGNREIHVKTLRFVTRK